MSSPFLYGSLCFVAVLALWAAARYLRQGANRVSAMLFLLLGGFFVCYALKSFGQLDFTHGPAYLSIITGGALYYFGAKLSDAVNQEALID